MAKSNLSGAFVGVFDPDWIDGNMWRLDQSGGFGLLVDGFGTIMPDNGFCFDFASIPRPIRWFYPKTGAGKSGQYGRAACIHDWLYSYPVDPRTGQKLDREFCDRVFLLGMELDKVKPTMRSLFYRAVRIGGSRYFGKPDKLNKLRS
jgi:hypothetical protein